MGEFAGYAIDEAIDAENDRWLYRQGVMNDDDAFDLGVIDNYGQYNHVPMSPPVGKACKYCGLPGLSWMQTEAGWRLGNGNVVHSCEGYKNK